MHEVHDYKRLHLAQADFVVSQKLAEGDQNFSLALPTISLPSLQIQDKTVSTILPLLRQHPLT
jgi:hypothetical protein